MDDTTQARVRWFHPTPGRFVLALLAVEVLLWLSDRFGWLAWHKGYAVLTCVAGVGVAMLLMLVWFGVALIFRWRFQFGIRSLLVLVVVVALPCSWLAVALKQAREQKDAVAAIVKTRGRVFYDDGWLSSIKLSGFHVDLPGNGSQPTWLCTLVGYDFVNDVAYVRMRPTTTDSDLECFRRLPKTVAVSLCDTNVTDKALEHIKGLAHLKTLDLSLTKVSDVGLEQLKDLTELRQLDLGATGVTDEGVWKLQQALPNCQIYR